VSILELLDLSTSSAAEKPAASYRPSQAATSEARDTSSRSPLRCPRCAEINQSVSPYLSHILDIHFVEYQEKAPDPQRKKGEHKKSERVGVPVQARTARTARCLGSGVRGASVRDKRRNLCFSETRRQSLAPPNSSLSPASLTPSLSQRDGWVLTQRDGCTSLTQ
jgi:uncharacterized C2H2 Zn-finger protein